MSDLHSYPHSFCGNDDEGSHSGFIRRGDDLIDSSLLAPDASPLSPVSLSSQLTSLERLELQKLRSEVAELRTALAKHDKLDKKLDDNLDQLHHKWDDRLDDKHESRWEASAASAASTWPNSSPETGSISRSRRSSCAEMSSPTSPGVCRSPSPVKYGKWDWVLQERAYCFARNFFLDEPGRRTRGELGAALEQVPDIFAFFLEHFPSFFAGEPTEVVDWNDFVQAYVQYCKTSKSTSAGVSDDIFRSTASGCVSELQEVSTPPSTLDLLTLQDYKDSLRISKPLMESPESAPFSKGEMPSATGLVNPQACAQAFAPPSEAAAGGLASGPLSQQDSWLVEGGPQASSWSGTKRFGDLLSEKRPGPETGSPGLLQNQRVQALGTKSYTGYEDYKPSRWGGSGALSPRESGVPSPSVVAIPPSSMALPTSIPSPRREISPISPRTAAGPLPPLDFPLPNKQELKGCHPGVKCIEQVSSPRSARSASSRGKPHFPTSSVAYSMRSPIFPQPVLLPSPTSCRTWDGSDLNHLHGAPAFTSGLAMMRHARNVGEQFMSVAPVPSHRCDSPRLRSVSPFDARYSYIAPALPRSVTPPPRSPMRGAVFYAKAHSLWPCHNS